MYFVNKASVYDYHIEVDYTINYPGNVVVPHKDFLYTGPVGDWTSINFYGKLDYFDFLNTLVYKNKDVCRRLAKIALDTNLNKPNPEYIKIMNAIRILDPTFHVPWINLHCGWQKELMLEICNSTSFHVIAICRNKTRLGRYFNVLKQLSD